jgi:hypothetical protein
VVNKLGYYINVFIKGEKYELNGQKLQFDQKIGKLFFFYVCKFDEETLGYTTTDETAIFTSKELYYIKRFDEQPIKGGLRKIGKDKVFQKY